MVFLCHICTIDVYIIIGYPSVVVIHICISIHTSFLNVISNCIIFISHSSTTPIGITFRKEDFCLDSPKMCIWTFPCIRYFFRMFSPCWYWHLWSHVIFLKSFIYCCIVTISLFISESALKPAFHSSSFCCFISSCALSFIDLHSKYTLIRFPNTCSSAALVIPCLLTATNSFFNAFSPVVG